MSQKWGQVHFYETFLAAYNPKLRKVRGVYYTPQSVVSYIVRSIDHLLKTGFGLHRGLADESTLILDPGTGTATFLYFVVRYIYEQFASQKGAWDSYVSNHLLKRVFGFELLMASYAVAHLKLGMELHETGYKFDSAQRLGIYLTNTLEEAATKSEKLIAKWISDEANEASEIKRDKPILVILGNPPYSGHSANRSEVVRQLRPGDSYKVISGGPLRANKVTKLLTAKKAKKIREKTFIGDLLDDYKIVDGAPLHEKNPKWLQDDYVKFIRFAQWRLERTGYGILGFITNHGYLDNPTFRGMRQSLMQSFNAIYVYNLHGNSKKKERPPGGGDDKNVFDIQQGVAILLAVKEKGNTQPAQVHHCDLWGPRKAKYTVLSEQQVGNTAWTLLAPSTPMYLFVPQETARLKEYESGWKLTDAMPINAIGMNSHRDPFAVAFEPSALKQRVDDLISPGRTDDELRDQYGLKDTSDFTLSRARESLRKIEKPANLIVPCVYRPFDERFVIYHPDILDRPRPELNVHFVGRQNLGIVTTRQTREPFGTLVVDEVCGQHKIVATYDGSSIVPLYLYPPMTDTAVAQGSLAVESSTWPAGPGGRQPNISAAFVEGLEKRLGLHFVPDGCGNLETTFGPEDVLHYLYAVFHSPTYRKRYTEFLKSDFPRVQFTRDHSLLTTLTQKGSELAALHLMAAPTLNQLVTTFPEKGRNLVDYVTYVDASQRICINAIQYFQGVAREVWGFHIGGYQVLERWLKDRKGRELTWDDIQHYQKIVVALKETIRLMAEIDAEIEAHGGWPLK